MCWVKQNRSIPANNWQFRYSLSIHTVVSFVFNTEKPDPCAMRPCTYRGTCVPDWSNMTYTCVCDSKYKGDHCERGKATTNLNIHWYKHFWFHITLHPVRTRVENTPAYHIPPSSCDILSPLFFSPALFATGTFFLKRSSGPLPLRYSGVWFIWPYCILVLRRQSV